MENPERLRRAGEIRPGAFHVAHRVERGRATSGVAGGRVRFLGSARLEIRGDFLYPRHRHAVFELIFVEHGTYRCRVNGAALVLVAGDLLVVKPGDWHEVPLQRGQRHLALHLSVQPALAGGGSADGLFRPGVEPGLQVIRGVRGDLRALPRQLMREAERNDPFSAHLQDTLAEEVFWRVLRALPEEARAPGFQRADGGNSFAARIGNLFHAHAQASADVPAMARTLGMSPRTLTARCRQELGLGPAHAFMRFKLERAAALLLETPATIKEVSSLFGFKNPYHFSKVFRRHLGRSPSSFRTKGS